MSDQKIFYEIQLPKKEDEYVIRLVEISSLYESDYCMHKLAGNRRCYNSPDAQCEFCGLWTCTSHFDNKQRIWIEQNSGFGNQGRGGYHASPCEQCAQLPKEDMLKLRALRLEMNS